MIECKLREIAERNFFPLNEEEQLRNGRYHGSVFSKVDGHVVAVYVETKEKLTVLFEEGLSLEQIISGCLEYLNSQMLGQRGKKKTIPKYGKLSLFSCSLQEIKEEYYISALLVTDDGNSKFFWPCRKKKY